MMWNRTVILPLVALIGAGIVDGAVLGGTRFAGWSISAWPVVIGLAALVIATLAEHSHAVTAELEEGPGAWFAVVDGQTKLIASGLIIAGLAVVLAAMAPRGGTGFTTWAGLAAVTMGFLLAIFKAAFGRRPRSGAQPRDDSGAPYRAS